MNLLSCGTFLENVYLVLLASIAKRAHGGHMVDEMITPPPCKVEFECYTIIFKIEFVGIGREIWSGTGRH